MPLCERIAGIIDGLFLIYCSRRASIIAHIVWLNVSSFLISMVITAADNCLFYQQNED